MMAVEPIRVVVVDDHPMFRAGLIQALCVEGEFAVIGEGGSAAEALGLVRSLRPSVLLLDARMTDSGIDRVSEILAAHPEVRIVMVTASQDQEDVARALDAGVCGYVLKGTTGPEMRQIIRSIVAGENYIAPDLMKGLWGALKTKSRQAEDDTKLSRREVQVLQLLALGMNNREIGLRLNVTEKTVKFHLSNVFAKLHVRNRVEASIIARRTWPDLTSKG
ncbi:response regulator transcription factor [Devosia sp.]|uniref:response regulator transcription factor n=1 Tax=Devosia sp. TaxID=1871048 RepID=UPI002FC931F3